MVDGKNRLSYTECYGRVSALVDGLNRLGLTRGDRLVTALQNNIAAISVYWACQMAGVAIVPVNWRAKPEELDFFLENSEAKALVFDGSSRESVSQASMASARPSIGYKAEVTGSLDFDKLAQVRADGAGRVRREGCGRAGAAAAAGGAGGHGSGTGNGTAGTTNRGTGAQGGGATAGCAAAGGSGIVIIRYKFQ